ncbi:MAG: hypothetical protein AAFX57_15265 [Bacteroidota bacterium]
MKTLVFSLFISVTFGHLATAQSSDWKQLLQQELEEFKACMKQSDNIKCRSAIGETIKAVYNIDDFYLSATGTNSTALEIANSIESKSAWKKLGQAYIQEVLTEAQELANRKKPVLAIYKGEDGLSAHVVLVLPGGLKPSGSWGLNVPMVASFFTHDPEKSFIDKSLAYAFSKNMLLRIELYARI